MLDGQFRARLFVHWPIEIGALNRKFFRAIIVMAPVLITKPNEHNSLGRRLSASTQVAEEAVAD